MMHAFDKLWSMNNGRWTSALVALTIETTLSAAAARSGISASTLAATKSKRVSVASWPRPAASCLMSL